MAAPQIKNLAQTVQCLLMLAAFCLTLPAFALDLSKYLTLKPGNQWSWVSGGVTKTETIGSAVELPSGVWALIDTTVNSNEAGTTVNYVTIDQYGYRLHQGYVSNVVIDGKTTTGTMVLTPPLVAAPLSVEIGKSYTSSSTVVMTYANVGSYTLNLTVNSNFLGYEAVSNQAGTKSWIALKVMHTDTMSGTVNGQFISDTTSSTSWLVEDLGEVQYESKNKAGVTETWKLVSTNVVQPTVTTTTTTTLPAAAGASSSDTSVVLTLEQGWSLLGNTLDQTISVASVFGEFSAVTTVWKWDVANATWQFYTPTLEAAALEAYAKSKGYGLLTSLEPGDGYWVNAKSRTYLGTVTGQPYKIEPNKLRAGWNLLATANKITPTALNLLITDPLAHPPAAGTIPTSLTTLWAWDSALTKWYFYAPSLEASVSATTCGCGGAKSGNKLQDYANSKGYLDFASTSKTLGPGVGFWVNKP